MDLDRLNSISKSKSTLISNVGIAKGGASDEFVVEDFSKFGIPEWKRNIGENIWNGILSKKCIQLVVWNYYVDGLLFPWHSLFTFLIYEKQRALCQITQK